MKFKEYEYNNFDDFRKAVTQVFSNIEFLDSITTESNSYGIRMFKNKRDLKVYLKDRFDTNREPYVVLSGSLTSTDDTSYLVVMLLPDVTSSLDSIIIGGVL